MQILAHHGVNPPAINQGINNRLARMMAKPLVVAWKPEPGERLGGVIVGSRMELNPYGQSQQQMLVQEPTGRVVAVWLSAWMLAQLRAKGAEKGDLVALTLLGKGKSQRGAAYNQYSVEVEKAQSPEIIR